MKMSRTSALAALAMAYLVGRAEEGVIQARQVAEHLNIPTDSALKILQSLARHRLIDSQLGRSGGYRMSKPSDQITLLHIVEAIDGPIEAGVPIYNTGPRNVPGVISLQSVCDQVAQRVRSELSGTTVAMLATDDIVLDLQQVH